MTDIHKASAKSPLPSLCKQLLPPPGCVTLDNLPVVSKRLDRMDAKVPPSKALPL